MLALYNDSEPVDVLTVTDRLRQMGKLEAIEKWLKAGAVLQCPNQDCKYKKDLPVAPEVVGAQR